MNPQKLQLCLCADACTFGSCYDLSLYTSPPRVQIAAFGVDTKDFRQTCGSGGCHYFATYRTQVTAEEALYLLRAERWQCNELTWRCEGSAFPYGSASIQLLPDPSGALGVSLELFVFWE